MVHKKCSDLIEFKIIIFSPHILLVEKFNYHENEFWYLENEEFLTFTRT